MKRGAWIALAVTALSLEASALFFQYGLDLNPCVMCIYIRMAVLAAIRSEEFKRRIEELGGYETGLTGKEMRVITSYSIHYTKLYDAGWPD